MTDRELLLALIPDVNVLLAAHLSGSPNDMEVADSAAERLKKLLHDSSRLGAGYRCPTCDQEASEVEVTVTGVCPTHGITSIVCGNPNCWCSVDS